MARAKDRERWSALLTSLLSVFQMHKKCNLITQDSYQNYIIMVSDNSSVGLDGVTSSKVVRK